MFIRFRFVLTKTLISLVVQSITKALEPAADWGPKDPKVRKEWEAFRAEKRANAKYTTLFQSGNGSFLRFRLPEL
jgi:hypothetical protein